jgi:nucleotide-binding universal stress UspA family protein
MVVTSALRRILVATDFSPGAAAAVERAVELARAHGAALDLLHVFDVGAWHSLKGVFDAQRLTVDPPPDVASRQRLSDVAAKLAADAGLEVEAHFGIGAAAERIVAHARERGCALVVLGARADPGWLGLGGTASKVVRAPSCPVLTVRLNAARPYERVLIAVDLREGALKASQFALRLLPQARHHAFYALDPASERDLRIGGLGQEHVRLLRDSMRAYAHRELEQLASGLSRDARHAVSAEVVDDVPSRAIVQRAASMPADCVVVGHHGEAALAERWLGNMAQHVLHHTNRDVLVVP